MLNLCCVFSCSLEYRRGSWGKSNELTSSSPPHIFNFIPFFLVVSKKWKEAAADTPLSKGEVSGTCHLIARREVTIWQASLVAGRTSGKERLQKGSNVSLRSKVAESCGAWKTTYCNSRQELLKPGKAGSKDRIPTGCHKDQFQFLGYHSFQPNKEDCCYSCRAEVTSKLASCQVPIFKCHLSFGGGNNGSDCPQMLKKLAVGKTTTTTTFSCQNGPRTLASLGHTDGLQLILKVNLWLHLWRMISTFS